jgi:hypothetical protein
VTERIPLLEGWDYHFKDLVDKYPGFREFLDGEYFGMPEEGCRELKKIRMVLYTIARHEAGRPLCPANQPGPHLERVVYTQTDAGGILRVVYDPLLRALEGVEAARIRECAHCGKIYWAGRIDMRGCKECTHALRQQRYRQNYLQKYKEQRYKREQQSQHKPPTRAKKE